MKLVYELNNETLQDLINISTGVFYPLSGFMTSPDYHNVVAHMRLSDNSVWTIPITLDVDHDTYLKAMGTDKLYLTYQTKEIGFIEIADCYKVDIKKDVVKVFKTGDVNHPVVKKELGRFEYRVGGRATVTDESISANSLNPKKTKEVFAQNNWKTIVGFHTRNPVHRAHEHLQRVGLELCDGLFINPFLGWKKAGDFSDEAIMNSYYVLIENYYPKDRVYIEGLKTSMRYAGPREAIFHALIRRNLGCTHFIIGRDHAGVGSYYGKYEAQELAEEIISKEDLGIGLLLLKEPYFCDKCSQIVTEKHCGHNEDHKVSISGTQIREMLREGKRPDKRFLRPEVTDALLALGERRFIE